MVLARTSVHMVERAPSNGCCQCLSPQGRLQLPPASPGDSSWSAGRSDPGSFQISASALDPRAFETLSVPFKSEVSIYPSLLGLSKVIPTGFQCQMLLGAHHGAGHLGWGAQHGAWTPHPVGRTSAICTCSSVCRSPTQWYGNWLYHDSASPVCLLVIPSLCLCYQSFPVASCLLN